MKQFDDVMSDLDENGNGNGSGLSGSKKKDLALGVLAGACSGVVFGRAGKLAAVALAGGVFFVRVLEQKGYLEVDWNKLTKDYQRSKKVLAESDHKLINRAKKFATTYKYFLTGMSGGFIIGILLS